MTLFQQPSGLSAAAENKQNLPEGYYEGIASMADAYHVHRFVHGKIGYDRSGMPVYPEFDPDEHAPKIPVLPVPGREIHLGLDASGLHPGGVIVDRTPSGQIRVLEEIWAGRVGPTRYGEILAGILAARYPQNPLGYSFYDPSNDYGADKESGDLSTIDILRKAIGGPLLAAPSNEVKLRIEAVRNRLMMKILMPNGSRAPGLIINRARCPMLFKGFMSHYRFRLLPGGQVANSESPKPEKNDFANLHDATQYAALGLDGVVGAVRAAAKGARAGTFGANTRNFVAKMEFSL